MLCGCEICNKTVRLGRAYAVLVLFACLGRGPWRACVRAQWGSADFKMCGEDFLTYSE